MAFNFYLYQNKMDNAAIILSDIEDDEAPSTQPWWFGLTYGEYTDSAIFPIRPTVSKEIRNLSIINLCCTLNLLLAGLRPLVRISVVAITVVYAFCNT